MDDVGEQVSGARTALTITNCAEKPLHPVGRSFLFDCTRPTDEYCPLFLGPSIVIFEHQVAAKLMYFSFPRKVLSGFAAPFFIAFRSKSFRLHGPRRLFFFLAHAGHLTRRSGRARHIFRS
jgi:hypothetical protein